MGVTDWGEINQPLGAPALGGAGGWADSVAQALNNSDETVDARLAALEAAMEALISTAQGAADAAQADVDALGIWQHWTPTITGCTVSSGTYRYTRIGDTVHWSAFITISAMAGPDVKITLPSTGTGEANSVVAHAIRSGVGRYACFLARYGDAADTVTIKGVDYTLSGMEIPLSSASPWTWGNGDRLVLAGTYETT